MFINTSTLDYPLTAPEIIRANPGSSFPVPFELPDGYAEVAETAPSEFDRSTQKLVEVTPVLDGDVWRQAWAIAQSTASDYSLLRDALKAAATTRRWEVETGGITLSNGLQVATAKADRGWVSDVITNADNAGIESVEFKQGSGCWETLTMPEVLHVAAEITKHVQACFRAERAHHDAIDGLANTDLAAYDINTGWPG